MNERITEDWTFKDFPEELTLSDVAHLLNISPQTIGRLRESKDLIVKSGRVDKQDLLDFIERHFIVNVPAFSVEENLEGYIKKNGELPAVLGENSIVYILNEIPETLKNYPGYKNKKISKEDFIKYLYEVEDIAAVVDLVG